MTTTPPVVAARAPALPIQVNADLGRDQAEALVRQVLASAGLIVAAFGLAKAAGALDLLAGLAGPIVSVLFGLVGLGAIVWGQVKTRALAAKALAMANLLDDSLARAR